MGLVVKNNQPPAHPLDILTASRGLSNDGECWALRWGRNHQMIGQSGRAAGGGDSGWASDEGQQRKGEHPGFSA